MEHSKAIPILNWLPVAGLVATMLSSCRSTETGSMVASEDLRDVPAGVSQAKVSGGSDLKELVAFALQNQPEIHAAEAKMRRLMAKVPQVGALPDPKFKASAGSMAETAAGRVDWMAGVEQALPYPGKLRELAKAAGRDAEVAAAQLEAVRLAVAARVEQAYWNLYLANQTSSITTENQNALELIRESVDSRIAANQGNQDDQLRLATEAGKLEKALIESRRSEASARARLNSVLNQPAGSAP